MRRRDGAGQDVARPDDAIARLHKRRRAAEREAQKALGLRTVDDYLDYRRDRQTERLAYLAQRKNNSGE